MAIQTVSTTNTLTNATRSQYIEDYLAGAQMVRLYDQISSPVGRNMSELERGTTVTIPFISDMAPSTSAISELTDITPSALVDATATVTPTSRAQALQASERLLIQAYTDYGAQMYSRVGKAMMESVDVLARDQATQGSLVYRPNATAKTRVTLSKAATGHYADYSLFSNIGSWLENLKSPGFVDGGVKSWAAIMHPAVYKDILEGSNIVSIAQYQKAEILLSWELGMLGPFRLVVSPWAKVFYGAGAADATDPVSTTTNTAVNELGTSFAAASATHLDNSGQWLLIGEVESADTHVTTNERVRLVSSISGSTCTIVGEGANGGFRKSHAAGVVINNSSSVYTIVFGGPMSLAKVYATEVGEFGQVVGPKRQGLVDQWVSLGYKWYGGYGRVSQSWLVRAEVAARADTL